MPAHRSGRGAPGRAGAEPVWYGGGKLADLSLPKLRAHWQAAAPADLGRGADEPERLSPRLRLRHQVEQAAGGARSPDDFFGRLRAGGVLVRERFSERDPTEITGFSVALPGDTDGAGEPIWRGGGSLDPGLSFPRLQARWADAEAGGPGATEPTPMTAHERKEVWREARDAAERAAEEIRRLQHSDPTAAGETARSAADLLQAAAWAGEPRGQGRMHDAVRSYDRASRETYGRRGPRTGAGADLRMAAVTVALIAARRTGRRCRLPRSSRDPERPARSGGRAAGHPTARGRGDRGPRRSRPPPWGGGQPDTPAGHPASPAAGVHAPPGSCDPYRPPEPPKPTRGR